MKYTQPAAPITMLIARIAATVLVLSIGVLTIGPFQGAEHHIRLSDKQAHVLAFYALAVVASQALPKWKLLYVAALCLAFGGIVELAQLTVGRSADLGDWSADAFGIALAVIPVWAFQLGRGLITLKSN